LFICSKSLKTKKIKMKKTIIILLICLIGFPVLAQDEPVAEPVNEPVVELNDYLPNTGDIAIGLEATPFFNFVGNMFNGTEDNSLDLGDNTLYFRYYLKRDAAIRVAFRINSDGGSSENYVRDDAAFFADPLSQDKVIDKYNYTENNFEIRLGYQMFRNYKRFRGYFGGDLGYQYYKYKYNYEYGNKMTELNPNPTNAWGFGSPRPLEYNYAAEHGIGAGAFVGVEYYFFPKVCIGGEFGLTYYTSFEGQSYRTEERMVITEHVTEEVPTNPGNYDWSLNTNFPYYFGHLYFMINF
jgi:hypothetical protein